MVKSVMGGVGNMREGWQERQQAELNEVVCGSSLRAIERLGWRFTEKLRFLNGDEYTITVRCD